MSRHTNRPQPGKCQAVLGQALAGTHPGAHGTGSMPGGGRTGWPTRPRTHNSHSLQPADKEDLSERGHSSVQDSGGGDLGQAQAPFLKPPWKTLVLEGRLSVCSPVTLDPARNQSKTWGREFVGQKLLSSFNSAWLSWVVQKFRSAFFHLFFFNNFIYVFIFGCTRSR